jgi:hypothetical protein
VTGNYGNQGRQYKPKPRKYGSPYGGTPSRSFYASKSKRGTSSQVSKPGSQVKRTCCVGPCPQTANRKIVFANGIGTYFYCDSHGWRLKNNSNTIEFIYL